MKALILVDIQNDFLPGGALAVPDGDQILTTVNNLVNKFDLVVATQDWHPKDHKSFASNHEGKSPNEVIELHGMEQILWPDHCVQTTHGAEFSDHLNVKPVEVIIRKGTDPEWDSYSGFYDNGHKKSTGLSDYLKGRKVTEVYVVGLAGDVCVFFTAMDAIKEGFKTFLIEDATRPLSEDDFREAKEKIRSDGGVVIQSDIL
jgi:nicotinamidase/pyrazinamidase